MRRKVSYLALGVAIGAMAAGILPRALPELTQSAFAAATDTYRQLNLFGDVFEKIRNDYVEKPDESKLIEAAINGMLSSLDPHSSYMDAKAYRDMQVQTNGEFGGLGIEVTQEDGLIKVVSPIDDTPASKAGVIGLTKVLSKELAKKRITVNAVAPGVVLTEMGKTIPGEVRAKMLENVPLGRFGEPTEIANVVLFLCSDLASYVTGQTIHVNGGWWG